MESLKEILDNSKDTDFPLLGSIYTATSQRIVYRKLLLKYNNVANIVRDEFKKLLNELKNIDDLLESLPTAFAIAMEKGLEELSKDAISIGDYSLDSNTIVEICNKEKYFSSFVNAYEQYQKYDQAILSNLSNAAAIRERNKNNRGRWAVTTIGGNMLDAWGNQLKISAVNGMEGVGYSIMNSIGNAIDESNAEDQRKALFHNSEYRKTVVSSVWTCANNLRMIVTNYISKRNNLSLSGWVSNADSNKAEGLYNNVIKFDLPEDKKREIIYEIFSLDPFNKKYYVGALTLFLDNGKEIIDIANFYNVNGIMNDISSILVNYTKNRLGTTVDDLINCRNSLKECAEKLSINTQYLTEANKLITDHSANILLDYVNKNLGSTEEDANNCKTQALELQKKLNISDETANGSFKIIESRLKTIDLQCRTVNGVVLATRDAATKSREDIKTYNKILNLRSEYKKKCDFITHISEINNLPIEQAIKDKYISDINREQEKFDKMCKKAARHQYRLDHNGNLFWNGDVLNMIIQYSILLFCICRVFKTIVIEKEFEPAIIIGCCIWTLVPSLLIFKVLPLKEEEVWNTLTESGKYSFSEIIRENKDENTKVNLQKNNQ